MDLLANKDDQKVILRIINIIMNHWIERNIIFPKINEIKLKQQKVKEEDKIRTSIIKQLKRNKSNSLYSLKDDSIQPRTKNFSCQKQKRHGYLVRKDKKKLHSYKSKEHLPELDETNEHQGVKYINIIELLEQRKHSFDSGPLKKMLKKLKYQQEEESNSLQKSPKAQNSNGRSLKKRYIKSKLQKSKTEPQQQMMGHVEDDPFSKECLKIKKMKKFDIHTLVKEQQEERQAKRQLFLKKKQMQQLKQTKLKITSIKGWNYEYQELIQYI